MSQMRQLTNRYLPFADAASEGLPMAQLLRLSLFQVSVGFPLYSKHYIDFLKKEK